MYGDRSHFLGSYEFLRHALPNNPTILLHGGEHFGPLEQPGELVRHIRSFFGSTVQPAATTHAPHEGALLTVYRQS